MAANLNRFIRLFMPYVDKSKKQESNPDNDWGLSMLRILVVIGFMTMVLTNLIAADSAKGIFWHSLGQSFLIALTAMVSGGLMGFLFGIPRSLQRNNEHDTHNYGSNTNLEQISDWLTKIIVGVSLTQLPAIRSGFSNLCLNLAPAVAMQNSYAFVGCVIIFFALCGFMSVYLWAKIYLLRALVENDGYVNRLSDLESSVEQGQRDNLQMKLSILDEKINRFNRQKQKVFLAESRDDVKQLLEIARPLPVRFLDDCQKNRWSSGETGEGYRLSAEFAKDAEERYYSVSLKLEAMDGQILEGPVYFFLHETYYPEMIVIQDVQDNGSAVCSFQSYEAFTVGVVANGGKLKLEFDLNRYAECPTDYRYTEDCETIDEIETQRAKLTAEIKSLENIGVAGVK
jgi:uncharacterized integral membrane protein